MSERKRKPIKNWVRDGSILSFGGTEIDIRNRRRSIWITVKGNSDRGTERAAKGLLTLLNGRGLP